VGGPRQGVRVRQGALRRADEGGFQGRGARAYALLREAIRESDRIGIATFILRDAQHVAAVEVVDLMERLRRSLDHSGAKPRVAKTRATKKASAKKRTCRAA
jgi:non-homologous end joining protein Ku